MKKEMKTLLRELPAVHQFIHDRTLVSWVKENNFSENIFFDMIKESIQFYRQQVLSGEIGNFSYSLIKEDIKNRLIQTRINNLRPVINGTGIILHTNLGRAVLAEEAIKHMTEIAIGYSNLEYRIQEGSRGSRHDHIEKLIMKLTGAEAAMVVNNNAAAVYLVLREMANKKEVIVSRGELVEIGGSFRVSEIMKESGAVLREIGTTNKTHLTDYEDAICEDTALMLKVHTSNFAITGFTKSVSVEKLKELGQIKNIPVYEDLGSGVLYDLRKHGIGNEPLIQESIQRGADIISFSGDKLLGGPQVGVIAGKKKWIDRMKKNQLARVLRVDKITLAGLEATLRLYLEPQLAAKKIPVLRDMLMTVEEIRKKAERFKDMLDGFEIELKDDWTEVGGGSLPGVFLPSIVAVIHHPDFPCHIIEEKLRQGNPTIVGRISKNQYLLDFRTIRTKEIPVLAQTIKTTLLNRNAAAEDVTVDKNEIQRYIQ